MTRPLTLLARLATTRPGLTLLALAVLTGAFGVAAMDLQMETDLASFGDEDSAVVQGMERVEDEFDRGDAAVQVILDAGPDGDVLTPDGLELLLEVEQALSDELAAELRVDDAGQPRLRSPGAAIERALQAEGSAPSGADAAAVGQAAGAVMRQEPRLGGLFSADRDPDKGQSRAVTILAALDPTLTTEQRLDAVERTRTALEIPPDELQGTRDGFTVTVTSPEVTEQALEEETRAEAPLLLLLALLAVIAVLVVLLRSVSDVVIGLLALLATLVWTFGAIAVLGPGLLDLRGPLSQIGVVVPVLVIGLGIDYAVHLVARYREQRGHGQLPSAAALTAIRTVGTALVLATIATAAGFAMTGLAPLAVVADFGVFTAVGVVAALVVMGGAVPAALVLRDRRRGSTTDAAPAADVPGGRWLALAGRIALARPGAVLLVGLVLAGAGVWSSTLLDTSFDRDDFIPQDSAIAQVVEDQERLFGGELTEATYVLIDAELEDAAMFTAMQEAHERLDEVEHVRRDLDGRPQVTSVVNLLEDRASTGDATEDLDDRYRQLEEAAGGELARLVRDDRRAAVVELRTDAGDAHAPGLADDLYEAFAPVEAAGGSVLVTGDAQVIAEMADDLRDFQVRSILYTLLTVLVLLVGYYTLGQRRPMLGLAAMIPSVLSAALLLATMAALDVSFDALTATLTAIAVGIGVPYGVHVTNRFQEDVAGSRDTATAIRSTMATTGGALLGSALTTFVAFAVLSFSGLALIGRLGALGAAGITYALLAAVIVQPAALVVWDRRRRRRIQPDDAGPNNTEAPPPMQERDRAVTVRPAGSPEEVELVVDDPDTVIYRVRSPSGERDGGSGWTLRIEPRPGARLELEHLDPGAVRAVLALAQEVARAPDASGEAEHLGS